MLTYVYLFASLA